MQTHLLSVVTGFSLSFSFFFQLFSCYHIDGGGAGAWSQGEVKSGSQQMSCQLLLFFFPLFTCFFCLLTQNPNLLDIPDQDMSFPPSRTSLLA